MRNDTAALHRAQASHGSIRLHRATRARTPRDREQIDVFMRQIWAEIAASHQVGIEVEIRTEGIEAINNAAPCESATGLLRVAGQRR